MQHLKFTRKEVDKLNSIKQSLEEKAGKLKTGTVRTTTDLEYIERNTKYLERFNKYKYQIFYLVNSNNWESEFEEWVNRICPIDENGKQNYMDVSALAIYLHNLIALQYPHISDTYRRMLNAIFAEQGFENGILILEELTEEEKDNEIGQHLKTKLHDCKLLSKHKDILIDLLTSDDSQEKLKSYFLKEGLEKEKVIQIFTEFSHSMDYIPETKGNELIEELIYENLDELTR